MKFLEKFTALGIYLTTLAIIITTFYIVTVIYITQLVNLS
jgi:hypothetical protein